MCVLLPCFCGGLLWELCGVLSCLCGGLLWELWVLLSCLGGGLLLQIFALFDWIWFLSAKSSGESSWSEKWIEIRSADALTFQRHAVLWSCEQLRLRSLHSNLCPQLCSPKNRGWSALECWVRNLICSPTLFFSDKLRPADARQFRRFRECDRRNAVTFSKISSWLPRSTIESFSRNSKSLTSAESAQWYPSRELFEFSKGNCDLRRVRFWSKKKQRKLKRRAYFGGVINGAAEFDEIEGIFCIRYTDALAIFKVVEEIWFLIEDDIFPQTFYFLHNLFRKAFIKTLECELDSYRIWIEEYSKELNFNTQMRMRISV